MIVICTEEEKRKLISVLANSTECLIHNIISDCSKEHPCRQCVENKITWKVEN